MKSDDPVPTEGTAGSRVNAENLHGNTFPVAAGEAVAEPSREPWTCKAMTSATDPPQECDWPHCGCDPSANKVLEALEESGAFVPRERVAQLEREIAEKDMAWTRALGFGGETPVTPEYAQESIAAHNREMSKRAEAAEARVALLEEKLAQFDAYGMPNVNAALLRIEKAEKEAHALKEILSDVAKYADTGSDSPETPWERLMQRVREALLSAGEHDQEGRWVVGQFQ